MQTITEVDNVASNPEEEKVKSPVTRISTLPKMENIKENTILITISFETGGSTVWGLHFEDVEGIGNDNLSLLETSVLLSSLDALPEGAMVVCVFKVKEIVEGALFPFRNEEVYVQPYFDEDGIMSYYEMMAKNNEDFFVYWNIEDGFEVKNRKTGDSLLVIQEVSTENPHFIGKDGFMLIEQESNIRLLFSVYKRPDWKEEDWNCLTGSILGMCHGTISGYSFVTGQTEVEEKSYSNRIMQDINAVETYRISLSNDEMDTCAEIDLDTDCVVLHCH